MPPRGLLSWEENTPAQNATYLLLSAAVVLVAGLMSGLTLGLLSMDTVDLEVLKRSGSPAEQLHAARVSPVLRRPHFLLVTLLLCNALAMEALPLLLDRLADPVTAVAVSVTVVLLFGEILPQAVCSKHGLAIGARLAGFVRALMWLTAPIAWPIAKLLDRILGGEHATLFRRKQLKALMDVHSETLGLGGTLTADEIKIIAGAFDLTGKTAFRSMTHLDKVSARAYGERAPGDTPPPLPLLYIHAVLWHTHTPTYVCMYMHMYILCIHHL